MEKIGEGLCVHQAMLDRDTEQLSRYPVCNIVNRLPDTQSILTHLCSLRPVRALVLWQLSWFGIDPECEEPVELWMERGLPYRLGEEIPVKRLEMSDVENDPVTLRNRPLIEGIRPNQVE
jgi:hypothetical protein